MQADGLRLPAVRVACDAPGIVLAIAVAGRPRPHPFINGSEGSHLTAWAVFADSVRRVAIGHSVTGAGREVRLLLEDLDTPEGHFAGVLPEPRRSQFNQMIEKGWDELARAEATGDPSALQRGIAMYLTGRNLAPMTAAFLGPAKARGRGEPTVLRKLREYESGMRYFTPRQLREMLIQLFDDEAFMFIRTGQGTPETVPGVIQNPAEAAYLVALWHSRELSRAYPLAHVASGLASPDVFRALFSGVTVATDEPLPTADPDWEPAIAGWSLTSGTSCLANIQLDYRQLDDSGSMTPFIGDLTLQGRGNTLLNAQGHHVTAHIAIEAMVQQAVLDKTVPEAMHVMLRLAQDIRMLANCPGEGAGGSADPKGILANAQANLFTAVEAAMNAFEDAPDVEDMVPELEGLIGAYIMMRNALPLAAVQRGANADAKAEGQSMAKLRAWAADPGLADADQVCWTMWQLLDMEAVEALWIEDGDVEDWAPGAPTDTEERVWRVLSVHLDTMTAAFPTLVGLARLRTTGSVAWVLNKKGIAMPASYRGLLGLAADNSIQPTTPFRSRAKRNEDDAEWTATPEKRRKRKRR